MPTKEGMELSSGALYFASSGEKIGELTEVSISESGLSVDAPTANFDFSKGTDSEISFTVKLKPMKRRVYNNTWRKVFGCSYTEYRFPKKRRRSRSRRRRNFFKKIVLCLNRFAKEDDEPDDGGKVLS